jgi:spore cortex formation protein SpoVR/YcgB (stage V sporulation)
MPGPDGIITVFGNFRNDKECEEGEAAFAEAMFFNEEFKEIHATTDPVEMLASKQEVSASPPTFKPIVDTKQVELVAGDATKTTSIGTNPTSK